MKTSKKDFLIRINDLYKRISCDEVFYLQSQGKYVSLFLENREYSFRGTLKELEQALPANFLRTHSSYIVNLDKISHIRNADNTIGLTNDKEISYSRTHKDNLLNQFIVG